MAKSVLKITRGKKRVPRDGNDGSDEVNSRGSVPGKPVVDSDGQKWTAEVSSEVASSGN